MTKPFFRCINVLLKGIDGELRMAGVSEASRGRWEPGGTAMRKITPEPRTERSVRTFSRLRRSRRRYRANACNARKRWFISEFWARPLPGRAFFLQSLTGIDRGIFRRFSALSSSVLFEIHKVFLQSMDIDRTKNHPKSALVDPLIVCIIV